MKELIGKKIKRIFVNEDQSVMFFETDKVNFAYSVGGDCCSESWFADVIGTNFLLTGTVVKVEEVNMYGYNVDDGRTRQECDEAYGYKIFTDKGQADIIFRNSSNGYYGGYLNDVEIDVDIPATAKEITEDWSA